MFLINLDLHKMRIKRYFLLCIFPVLLYIGFPAYSYAYFVDQDCNPTKATGTLNAYLLRNSTPRNVDANKWLNLQANQYLYLGYGGAGLPNSPVYLKLDCPNLGRKQSEIELRIDVTSPASSYILVPQSSLSDGASYSTSDKDVNVAMFKTNTKGVFVALILSPLYNSLEELMPSITPFSNDHDFMLQFGPRIYITKDYEWGSANAPITVAVPVSFRMYDAKDNSSAEQAGYRDYTGATFDSIPAGFVNIKSTCNYSLSESTVDFGDKNLSSITNSKSTTAKKSIKLNMKDCYGVNKVKTYITNTTNVLENGLVLGNSQTTNAAANVGIRMNIGSAAKENKDSDIYMDGTHPLEWNFGNTYDMVSISKEIPLDVFLLSSGGEPTTGDFKATATIMLDFI